MIPDKFIHPNPKTFDDPPSRRQYFSLPFGIISYITQNPISPNGLLNLQKTCKYFFIKNKIVVVDTHMEYEEDYLCDAIYRHGWKQEQKYYFNDFKYWLADSFYVLGKNVSGISKNIYRCTLESLNLHNVKLLENEFDFILNGSKLISLELIQVKIYKNEKRNSYISIDKILGKASNCRRFHYDCDNEIFNSEILLNLNSLEFNFKFSYFRLFMYTINSNTDILLLCDFIKKNADYRGNFSFWFKNEAEIYRSSFNVAVRKLIQFWQKQKLYESSPHVYVNI